VPSEDRLPLIAIAEKAARGKDGATQAEAFAQAAAYLKPVVAARKAKPGKDAISAIANGTVEGRPLTDEEILTMCSVILFGGLDTVASMLGMFAKFLAENPGHRQQLLNEPGLIPNAVEEILRRHHLVNIARMAAKDFVYKGIEFKRGDAILTPTPLAGLDDRVYAEPLTVDFHRQGPPHLVFGRGPHQCIGSFLARTELKVFVEEWLLRIPNFHIKPGEKVESGGGRVHTVSRLPLAWKVT
jgi:cytochrome P450